MATKFLTGTYASGYALAAKYSGLVLKSTALVEGTGVSASSLATVTNQGTIAAGAGAGGGSRRVPGGVGNIGVYFKAGGSLINHSAIDGAPAVLEAISMPAALEALRLSLPLWARRPIGASSSRAPAAKAGPTSSRAGQAPAVAPVAQESPLPPAEASPMAARLLVVRAALAAMAQNTEGWAATAARGLSWPLAVRSTTPLVLFSGVPAASVG